MTIKKQPTADSHSRIFRRFSGVVESAKMNKTLVVRVNSTKIHPLYQKRYQVSRRYHVHDEQNKIKPGETVEFVECRPLSRSKRWRVVKKIS